MDKLITAVESSIFKQITDLGGLIFYGLVIMSFLILGEWAMFWNLTVSIILMMVLAVGIKYFYFKERPKKQRKNNLLERLDASSFPSIHAMRVFSLAFWLSIFFNNPIFTVYLSITALIILYSRIYLKKHYLGDVVWGIIFSTIINLGVFFILR